MEWLSWVFVKMHIRNCYVIELVNFLTDAGFDDVESCKCLSINNGNINFLKMGNLKFPNLGGIIFLFL